MGSSWLVPFSWITLRLALASNPFSLQDDRLVSIVFSSRQASLRSSLKFWKREEDEVPWNSHFLELTYCWLEFWENLATLGFPLVRLSDHPFCLPEHGWWGRRSLQRKNKQKNNENLPETVHSRLMKTGEINLLLWHWNCEVNRINTSLRSKPIAYVVYLK